MVQGLETPRVFFEGIIVRDLPYVWHRLLTHTHTHLMVLIPQVQCIRKTSLYKTLWVSIPVVSGLIKVQGWSPRALGALYLDQGLFFFLEVWYPSACYPGCKISTSDDSWLYRPGLWSSLGHGYHTHLTVSDTWGWYCNIACSFYLSLLSFLWWKTLCPLYYVVIAITTNEGMES